MTQEPQPLAEALNLVSDGGRERGRVHPGYDVFGIPHGGYLAALAAHALLRATGRPDLFTQTTYFMRKATESPIDFEVEPIARSRRFINVRALARQDDKVVMAVTGTLGDREQFQGPEWSADAPWAPDPDHLIEEGGDVSKSLPNIARRFRMRLDSRTVGFMEGRQGPEAIIRAVAEPRPLDVLSAIAASDLTPPAVWNTLGMTGWVPTVELTTHIRARPRSGPLRIEARTRHVSEGFLEEDALVHDGDGRLIVQSRQLACYSG